MLGKPPTQHHFVPNPSTSGNMDLENPAESTCEHHNEENASGSELMMGMMGIQPQSFMMLMDPSMLGIQQFPILNMPTVTSPEHSKGTEGSSIVKEVIHCQSCTLLPPSSNYPPPTTRERPLGCKTCFIGGLPENITKEIIYEIFERCGEITTLRLSKKNFCHIRFAFEASVDSAIYLSGYRVKIGNSNDPANSGKLHVDYAQARDDQYE
jgi:RNA recognition motif. (a.k.a. RRM, RBD, or RNP domain)